jgi:hypothetical protein
MTATKATTRQRSTLRPLAGATTRPSVDPKLLAEAERELDQVEAQVRWDRMLLDTVRGAGSPHFARGGVAIEPTQEVRRIARRCRRMNFAADGLSDELIGVGYRDARMLFTGLVLYFGGLWRKRKPPRTAADKAWRQQNEEQNARGIAHRVAERYPLLRPSLSSPECVEAIRLAVDSARASPRRVPWRLLVKAWNGLELRPQSEERWRQDWVRHQARRSD